MANDIGDPLKKAPFMARYSTPRLRKRLQKKPAANDIKTFWARSKFRHIATWLKAGASGQAVYWKRSHREFRRPKPGKCGSRVGFAGRISRPARQHRSPGATTALAFHSVHRA